MQNKIQTSDLNTAIRKTIVKTTYQGNELILLTESENEQKMYQINNTSDHRLMAIHDWVIILKFQTSHLYKFSCKNSQ